MPHSQHLTFLHGNFLWVWNNPIFWCTGHICWTKEKFSLWASVQKVEACGLTEFWKSKHLIFFLSRLFIKDDSKNQNDSWGQGPVGPGVTKLLQVQVTSKSFWSQAKRLASWWSLELVQKFSLKLVKLLLRLGSLFRGASVSGPASLSSLKKYRLNVQGVPHVWMNVGKWIIRLLRHSNSKQFLQLDRKIAQMFRRPFAAQ